MLSLTPSWPPVRLQRRARHIGGCLSIWGLGEGEVGGVPGVGKCGPRGKTGELRFTEQRRPTTMYQREGRERKRI